MQVLDNIINNGYSPVDFPLSERDRVEVVARGVAVMDIIEEESLSGPSKTENLITTNQYPTIPGNANPWDVYYGRKGRASTDEKRYLHTNMLSIEKVRNAPRSETSSVLRDYMEGAEAILDCVRFTLCETVELEFGLDENTTKLIDEYVLAKDNPGFILRILEYKNAQMSEPGHEFGSAHSDLGFATQQIFETHRNTLQVTPFAAEKIHDDWQEVDFEYVSSARENFNVMNYNPDTECAFFMGAGSALLANHDGSLPFIEGRIPVGYHAVIQPEEPDVSMYAPLFNRESRVVMIGFSSPSPNTPIANYRIPSIAACRPENGKLQ